MSNWQVYIIEADDRSLYTGVTMEAERRLEEHQSGGPKAAKFFRGRKAIRLVYVESGLEKRQAYSREWAIKRMTRAQKLKLIASCESS